MSDLLDVMESTAGSGATMTTTLWDYGEGSLGKGILRLADEMRYIGYEEGVRDVAPVAFSSGLSQGRKEGTIVTVIVGGTLAFLAWSVCKLVKRKGRNKKVYCVNSLYSSEDGFELSPGDQVEVLEENGEKLVICKVGASNETHIVPRSIIEE